MALRYSGSAVLLSAAGIFTVHAELATNLGSGVYSWGGKLTTSEVSAIGLQDQGGTLTLPGMPDVPVHVTVADLAEQGGVLLRVNGHGTAPYERDGEVVTRPREGGGTVYQLADADV